MTDLWGLVQDLCRSRAGIPGAWGCIQPFSCSWRCPLAEWVDDVPPCPQPRFGCCRGAAAVQHGRVFACTARCFFPVGSNNCQGLSLSQSDALWFKRAFCRVDPPSSSRVPQQHPEALLGSGKGRLDYLAAAGTGQRRLNPKPAATWGETLRKHR